MAEMGTGVLPLSIIPPGATLIATSCTLYLNNAHEETYELSGEPTTEALSTAKTQRLHNQKGYLPVS
jgi:hypothetical protein